MYRWQMGAPKDGGHAGVGIMNDRFAI